MCGQCGLVLVVWLGRIDHHLVLRRSLSGTVGASHRKPPWARLTRFCGPAWALGIKPWLVYITPMSVVTMTVEPFNLAEPIVKLRRRATLFLHNGC